MSHGILLNKLTAEINYCAIDKDYDIYRITGGSEDYYRSNILDIPNYEFKALSVQYTYGKTAFVLFGKGKVSEIVFRNAIQEKYKEACVQKLDITDEAVRKSNYLHDNILIQLLANSIKVPKNDLFSYNNTSGKLYYFSPKWNKKNSFYCIEIKLEKDNIIKLYVRSFRTKDEKNTASGFIFDPLSGELRKKLSTDKNVTEYILKGNKNKKNTVDFLRFNTSEDFYHSKLGILYRFLKDMEYEYGKYVTLTLSEMQETYDYEIPKTEKAEKTYLRYSSLLNNEVNIVDEVKTKESSELIEKIRYELSRFYAMEVTSGEMSDDGINIRIVHEPDYYREKNIPDPHNNVPKGIVVQHMIIEDSKHFETPQNNDKPSADLRKIIQELMIKQDIKNGMITCFDWKSLCYDRDVIFITREEIPHNKADQPNKKEKGYIYKIMHISPNGEIHFRAFASNDSMNDKDLQISGIYEDFKNRFALYPNEIEGIMVTNSDNYSVIIKTACTTMPNIISIAKSLEKKPFSRETLLDAVSAFKTERPEYSDYVNGIEKMLYMENEISYKYANSCLDIRHNKKAGTALNRFIFANYGIRINPEIKSKDNDEEYLLKNICGIRYYYERERNDTKVLAYFVGTKRSSLKTSVHNACVIRKVYSDDVIPEPDKLFRLMSVEFVRNEQYTVIPFPFKYLREYSAY